MNEYVPLDKKFLKRTPGVLQNKATLLQKKLNITNGSMVINEVARLCRHVAAIALTMQEMKLPIIRSYNAAVPILGITSKIARKISTSKGLDSINKDTD